MLRGEGGDTRPVGRVRAGAWTGEMQPRCSRDAAEMQPRCSGGRVRAGAACRDAESAGEAAVLRRLIK